MIVTGEITLPAPREIVFQVLQDAPFFASCVEGVRDLKEIDTTHYDAVLHTKVAYMNFTFKVSVEVTRLSPPERIEAKIEGTPLGIVGRFTAVSTTDLIEAGGETVVKYAIDANITGKLGSMGQPVLRSKAKEMERKFAENMRAAFAGPLPALSPQSKSAVGDFDQSGDGPKPAHPRFQPGEGTGGGSSGSGAAS
jgi:uncharacterized protein